MPKVGLGLSSSQSHLIRNAHDMISRFVIPRPPCCNGRVTRVATPPGNVLPSNLVVPAKGMMSPLVDLLNEPLGYVKRHKEVDGDGR